MMLNRALSVFAGTVCAVTLTAWPAAAAPVNAPDVRESRLRALAVWSTSLWRLATGNGITHSLSDLTRSLSPIHSFSL